MDICMMISAIPVWAWFYLVIILFIGISAFRSRDAHVPSLFFIPAILFGVMYRYFFTEYGMFYLANVVVGSLLGAVFAANQSLKNDKKSCIVRLPGSPMTLILLLTFFSLRFVVVPLQLVDLQYLNTWLMIESIGGMLIGGFFLGRAAYLQWQCWK